MQELSAFLNHMDWSSLVQLLLRVAAVLFCIVVHEVCHGVAAYYLGDPTAKTQKRLSLNPLRHIDPFGALMMLLVGFGWAKPVPVDMRYFKKPKIGMAVTALAGPLSNFILAYIMMLLAHMFLGVFVVSEAAYTALTQGVLDFCMMTAGLSIGLGVFNLIPFPPLDGSKILGLVLPDRIYYKVLRYEFAGTIVLMALLWLGVLDVPLYAARSFVSENFMMLAQWPYDLITARF